MCTLNRLPSYASIGESSATPMAASPPANSHDR